MCNGCAPPEPLTLEVGLRYRHKVTVTFTLETKRDVQRSVHTVQEILNLSSGPQGAGSCTAYAQHAQ